MVDVLLRKGISTKTVSPCPLGMSPLLYASKYSSSEMVLCFLKAGANIRSCWIWKINKVVPLDVVTHRIEQSGLKKRGRGSLIVLPRSRSPSPLRVKNRRATSASPAKLKRRRLQEIRKQLQEEAELKFALFTFICNTCYAYMSNNIQYKIVYRCFLLDFHINLFHSLFLNLQRV